MVVPGLFLHEAVCVLVVAAACTAVVPARRATRVNPILALRTE